MRNKDLKIFLLAEDGEDFHKCLNMFLLKITVQCLHLGPYPDPATLIKNSSYCIKAEGNINFIPFLY
jgi:hypothetical protein